MNFKDILKSSIFYILVTSFLENLYYLIFNIQDYLEAGFAQLLFNSFVYSILFIFLLVRLLNRMTKKDSYSFKEILGSAFSMIVFIYVLDYLNAVLFHYLNELIHAPIRSEKVGFENLMGIMTSTFGMPTFAIIDGLFRNPFYALLDAISLLNFKMFYFNVLYSKIISTTIVIFYYSLYVLFEKFDRKGIEAIIPIKNNLTLLAITHKPTWWILPLLVPVLRYIPKYYINKELSKKYQKKFMFAIGMTVIPWLFYGQLILNKEITEKEETI
ncbi:DUF5684 domain-containing protein [Cellulophaga sp. HaHa_2_1]|uniref:DUF5684 domain-containing protein n=1 Tax=Cellulophaga sp. HaHa_2_1 TaxID=2749994 RepID=UPI001C4E6B98|nr:DUF5684 domain-containing protein [Cellulophaga sp. HaHa_2_1]QXP54133.1 hypothetical protein H0I24_09465 [Cellulophaga sp. HaHa_2_1]